jgi:Cu/Ag efflux pump CusA
VVGINSGESWISIDPQAGYEATVAAVRAVINDYPGLISQVQTYQPERIDEALTRPDQDLVVRVYGHDLALLRDKGEEVRQILSGIGGVVDARIDRQAQEPQVEIEANMAAAAGYGLKPGDIRRQATTLLSGLNVGNLFEEQKVFEVVVWGVPEIRHNLTNINELLLDTPDGGQVPLGEVADVRIVPAETMIKRDAVSRYIDIRANLSGRNFATVVANIKDRLQRVDFPFEFHAEVLSDSVERQAALQRLLAVAVAAVIGIFLLMQAAFGSWRLAFFVFLTLPMALTGGVLAAFIGGGILSLGSLVGFLAVLAIAARNGIAMISHFHQLERHEGETLGLELVLRGARERLGPILMTALTTALALLPLVVAGNIAGNEIVHGIAVVVLGGLVTSTLLNLFIVPALYLRFGSSPEPAILSEQLRDEPSLGLA